MKARKSWRPRRELAARCRYRRNECAVRAGGEQRPLRTPEPIPFPVSLPFLPRSALISTKPAALTAVPARQSGPRGSSLPARSASPESGLGHLGSRDFFGTGRAMQARQRRRGRSLQRIREFPRRGFAAIGPLAPDLNALTSHSGGKHRDRLRSGHAHTGRQRLGFLPERSRAYVA